MLVNTKVKFLKCTCVNHWISEHEHTRDIILQEPLCLYADLQHAKLFWKSLSVPKKSLFKPRHRVCCNSMYYSPRWVELWLMYPEHPKNCQHKNGQMRSRCPHAHTHIHIHNVVRRAARHCSILEPVQLWHVCTITRRRGNSTSPKSYLLTHILVYVKEIPL